MSTNSGRFLFLIFSLFFALGIYGQEARYRVEGKIEGEYYGKMYLFFEKNYKQMDSLSSEIIDGKFYFEGSLQGQSLARLHLGQQTSLIIDFYIDSGITKIACFNSISISKADTMNYLKLKRIFPSSFLEKKKQSVIKALSDISKKPLDTNSKRKLYYESLFSFVKTSPSNRLSLHLINSASSLQPYQIKQLVGLVDTSMVRNTYEFDDTRRILKKLDKSKNWEAGKLIRYFQLPDTAGKMYTPNDLKGKITLIVFWASWCKPCRVKHPELKKFYEKNKHLGFEIVSISLDERFENWKAALIKDKLPWTNIIEIKGFDSDLASFYGITSIPGQILIDENGKIIPNSNYSIIEELLLKN